MKLESTQITQSRTAFARTVPGRGFEQTEKNSDVTHDSDNPTENGSHSEWAIPVLGTPLLLYGRVNAYDFRRISHLVRLQKPKNRVLFLKK